jgi:hypothetical protein
MLRVSQQHIQLQSELKARLRKMASAESTTVENSDNFVTPDMALPVRKKSQLIFPLDLGTGLYTISETDKRFLRKYAEKVEIDLTISNILNNRNLNPLRNSIKIFQFLLTLGMLSLFVLIIWLFLGILILFVYNPIVFLCLLYILIEVIAKSLYTYRGILLEKAKNKKLRNYLRGENLRYYNKKNLNWTLGHHGGWLQVDLIRK